MPIDYETPITSTTANGVTTLFPHAFTLLSKDDLVVKTELGGVVSYPVVDVDFTVSGVGTNSGAVTFAVAPANGTLVTRYRDTELKRATDYQENGDLLAETLDQDFDRVVMMVQELFAGGKGAPTSLRVPSGETIDALPKAADRALRILSFDSLGAPLLIAGVDAGSAAALALDLASTASASKGSGQIGYGASLSYSAGTLGAAVKTLAATVAALASAVNMGASSVAYASSLSIDASTPQVFMVGTLTGNATLSLTGTPTNGKALLFRFKQDATGSRVVTLPTGTLIAGLINPLANKVTWLTLIWVDSDSRYEGYWSALP